LHMLRKYSTTELHVHPQNNIKCWETHKCFLFLVS
jgi:hypothetical protein